MYSMKKTATWSLAIAVVGAAFAQTAQGQIIAGRSSNTEPAIHIDINTFVTTDLFTLSESGFNGSGVEGLAVDDANRTIYVCSGATSPNRQWILSAHYEDRLFDNPARLRLRKVVDVSPFLRLSGLAYDTVAGKLYATYPFGSGPEGVYEVNLTTGELTLVFDGSSIASAIDLRGFDFNPADGLLYATDLATLAPGRALVSIDLNTSTLTDIVSSIPLVAAASGMAIANNKAYIVPDDDDVGINAAGPIRVFDIASGTYDADLFNPWTGDATSAGAGWGPSVLDVPAGVNLAVDAIVTNRDTSVDWEDGTVISYTFRFTNFGPSNATNVTYTISLGGDATGTISNIFSSSATAVESPTGTVTATFTDFFVSQIETVSFDVTTTSTGALTVTANLPPGANSDPYLGNNSEAISHNIRDFPDINLEFVSIASSPKSLVPGMGGARIENTTGAGTERIRNPVGSPAGDYIAFHADTDAAAAIDFVYLRRDPMGDWSVVVQEGVTTTSTGHVVSAPTTTRRLALLDDGRFGYAIDTNAPIANDEMTIIFDGVNHTVVARESEPIPAIPGVGYGSTHDSVNLTGSGQFANRMSGLTGASSGQNIAIVAADGNTVLARAGHTIPLNQLGGGTLTIATLTSEQFAMDCIGSSYMYSGTLTGALNIVVVDGSVVFQQGGTVDGFGGTLASFSTVAGIISTQLLSNGVWYCRGTTGGDDDFVLRGNGTSYTTVAKKGDPIYTGSSELWSDVDGFAPTFMGYAANRQGDVVLTGRTDNPDVSRNAVAVLNGTTELFREGDRVDLDDNGLFDDDAFIDTFVVDMQLLTDQGDYYAVVNLRNAAGGFIGKALVHMANVGSAPLTGADVAVKKTVDDDFLESVGQQAVFTVSVCNYGPNDATNVVLNDPLPAGLAFVSATNGATETSPGSNVVTATIATLPSCGCEVYEITVEAVAEGVWENTASAEGNESDPNMANNSASATVTVENQADVAIAKEDDGGAPVGVNFTYTITITNHGPAAATNVQMTDNLDGLTSFVSATNGATETAPGSGIVTATFANIPANSSEIVTITVVGNFQALVTNIVSVTATEVDINSSNNDAFVDTLVGDVADVSVTLSNPGLQLIGEDFSFDLTVSNGGPAPATNVQVVANVPAGLSVVSLTNGAVENPPGSGNIEATFASIASQDSEVITITVNAPSEDTFDITASVSADEIDPDDLNNTTSMSTRTGEFLQILAIHTRIAGHPTATVPGLLDESNNPVFAEFNAFLNINVSEDGSRWTIDASSNLANANINSAMMLGSGFTGTVFAQEGKQAADAAPGVVYVFFDDEVGFNSNNDFSWGAIVSGGGITDITYTNIGGVNTNIARSGDPVFGLSTGSGTISNSMVSEFLLDDGSVGFNASNIATSQAALVFWNSGSGINVFAERNFTVVDGDLITGLPVSKIFYGTPDGQHTFYRASIAGGSMLVYDGSRVLRTGDGLLNGMTVNAVFDNQMVSNGDWIARGSDVVSGHWVVRNGVLIAATGMSVTGGSEAWGNSIGTARINAMGDYLITGNTNNPDPRFDNVMALNGTRIIARESDPVDLDGNGLFDDDVFITSFTANQAYLANDGRVHFLATLQNGEGLTLQNAFLVVDTATSATCPTIQGDADGDGARNGIDVAAFVDCILTGGTPTGSCVCVDYDSNNLIDLDDLDAFATQLVTDP